MSEQVVRQRHDKVRERVVQGFRTPDELQHFVSIHSPIRGFFSVPLRRRARCGPRLSSAVNHRYLEHRGRYHLTPSDIVLSADMGKLT